jgi:hypothetical protein
METLEFTLSQVIFLARNFSGSQPSFRISSCRKHLEITDSCSGFLKVLLSDDKVMAHFHGGVIQVQYFK